jgi:hypothetical protein
MPDHLRWSETGCIPYMLWKHQRSDFNGNLLSGFISVAIVARFGHSICTYGSEYL